MTTHRTVLQPALREIQSRQPRTNRAISPHHPPLLLLNIVCYGNGRIPRRNIRVPFTSELRRWIRFKKMGGAQGFIRQWSPTRCTTRLFKCRPSESGKMESNLATLRQTG